LIKRKVRYLIYDHQEFELGIGLSPSFEAESLCLWSRD
jgi:hypothetical protein